MQRVVNEYQQLAKENEDFRRFVRSLDEDLKARYAMRFLPPEEQEEYAKLVKKGASATPEEQKRMRELEEKGKQLERRVEELRQKSNPTDAEKQELNQLQQRELETQGRLEQLRKEYERQIQERNRMLSDRLDQNIRNAISFIAGQKGLKMVLDQSMVLFGGIDITNEVLAKLNEGS
jgi:outer membrane protein